MNRSLRPLLLSLLCGLAAIASCSEDTCQPLACRSSLVIKYSKDVPGFYRVSARAAGMTFDSNCPKTLAPLEEGVACDEKQLTLMGVTDMAPVMVTLTTVDSRPISSGMVTTTEGPGAMKNACSSCGTREGTLTW